MVSERITLGFDIKKLQDFFIEHVLTLPPAIRSVNVSGWSVLSSTGSYLDGWETAYLPYNGPFNQNPSWTPSKPEEKDVRTMQDCCRPTEICHGYMREIIDQIAQMGFYPRRARIIRLPAGKAGQWHQDGSKHHYIVRLHIPILTNPGCFFETETDRVQMPADGNGHLVQINCMHRVINQGEQDRYHLVMNVWDTRGLTKHHRYDASDLILRSVPESLF